MLDMERREFIGLVGGGGAAAPQRDAILPLLLASKPRQSSASMLGRPKTPLRDLKLFGG
jgi:hypothetical protein